MKKEGLMSELRSTLQVYNEEELRSEPGIGGPGQPLRRLIGDREHPSERLLAIVKTFEAGEHEQLHWHFIEAFYYVISGRGVVTDIEGKRYDVGPGAVIYAPPGIAGSHEWDIKEGLKLIGVRATNDPEKFIQFSVDRSNMESSIALDYLVKRAGTRFKSLY